jgi:SNF2 family DNA or RNA helicase
MSYPWKTQPFAHQKEWWVKTKDKAAWAVLWEQGTGKSKLTIDTIADLYLRDRIDCLLVIAPNGVHRNWTSKEVPEHLPDEIEWRPLLWVSSKANNRSAKEEAALALKFKGLLVVAMSYDALMTKLGDEYVTQLMAQRRVAMVLDESARIKNPKALRTRKVLAKGKAARVRRILTGTPVANSPFDVFSQFQFLDPAIWNSIGCRSYTAFKNYFGVWEEAMDPRSGRFYKNLVRYRNLNKLNEIVERVGCRVRKMDVLDLPPKLYQTRPFDLSAEQAKIYGQLAEDLYLRIDAGEVDAMLAIVQLIRFQQVASGFLPISDPTTGEQISIRHLDNARIRCFSEAVEEIDGKFIAWGKFSYDIDAMVRACDELGVESVRYDGQTSEADRADAITRFQKGSARAFIANPAAAGEGLTLHAATTVIYYNNSFKLTDRLQSEDRAHRIGQQHPVLYVDITATGTVDEKITTALRNKLDIASIVTGDKLRNWI